MILILSFRCRFKEERLLFYVAIFLPYLLYQVHSFYSFSYFFDGMDYLTMCFLSVLIYQNLCCYHVFHFMYFQSSHVVTIFWEAQSERSDLLHSRDFLSQIESRLLYPRIRFCPYFETLVNNFINNTKKKIKIVISSTISAI